MQLWVYDCSKSSGFRDEWVRVGVRRFIRFVESVGNDRIWVGIWGVKVLGLDPRAFRVQG